MTGRGVLKLEEARGICEMVMPRLDFRQGDPMPEARELVRLGVGGFLVFGGDVHRVSKCIAELTMLAPSPLFFAIDAERGVGQIVEGGVKLPFPMALGAADDPLLAARVGSLIAREMKSVGLNLLFAPVADVNTNPKNPIINIRSFGDDPVRVARLVGAFVEGVEGEGVLACAKHFPGHGGTDLDSHTSLPYSGESLREIEECHLIPFKSAIGSQVSSIMTAHVAFPALSPAPATLSPAVVRSLLIERLGFCGIVVTDSLRMDAVSLYAPQAEVARLAVGAGCDVLLDPMDPRALLRELSGSLRKEQIEGSLAKISSFKARLTRAGSESCDVSFEGEARSLRCEIAERSICLVAGAPGISSRASLFVLDAACDGSALGARFLLSLREGGVEASLVATWGGGGQAIDVPRDSNDTLVFLVYTGVSAGRRHTELPEFHGDFLRKAAALTRRKVLVVFGSPYVALGLGGFDTVIVALDRLEEFEDAAARVLLGSLKPLGRLPVRPSF